MSVTACDKKTLCIDVNRHFLFLVGIDFDWSILSIRPSQPHAVKNGVGLYTRVFSAIHGGIESLLLGLRT